MKKILALLLAFVLLSSLSCAAAMTPAGSLTYGDRGEEVLKIQQALAQLGYQVGKIDGSFGAYTENALRKFQKKYGLAVDGIAGARTRELLYEKANLASPSVQPIVVSPPAGTVSTPSASTGTAQASAVTSSDGSFFGGNYASIYPGQSGTRVVLLQNALLQLGYSVGRIDGKYGTNTKKAVSNFQKAQKLTVDGVAGKNTLRRMEELKSGTQTASSAGSSVSIIPTAQSTTNAGTTYKEGTLALGMTGTAVSTLQTQLKTLGYYASGIDGVFGSGTQAAVVAFQKASGLTADGVAGAKTQSGIAAALTRASTASTASTVTYRNLQTGSSGTDVSNLQTALKNLSYTVNVTGIYDAVTKAAVTLFQRQNKLTADGIAGVKTQTRLYSGSAAAAPAVTANTNNTGTAADTGTTSAAPTSSTVATADTGGPSRSSIKLLHWFNDIKPTLRTGQTILVYEPVSGISWTLRLYSLGRHADAEPLTADDTARMVKAFGGQNTWNQKAVYVRLPSGTWTLGSTHDMPHLSGAISNNNFDGHLCVHFLRTMSECEQNDPKYGVANQNTIRSAWKALTGETVN